MLLLSLRSIRCSASPLKNVLVEQHHLKKVHKRGLVVQGEIHTHHVVVIGDILDKLREHFGPPSLNGKKVLDEGLNLVKGEEGLL